MKRAFALAVLALALLPSAASAHAVVQSTSPAQGADVAQQPPVVSFTFDEPVEASFGAVKVFDSAGEEVQTGDLQRPGGDSTIGTALDSGLPDGTYTATYHVISADSHPVSGGFVFSIGNPGKGSSKTVEELLDAGGAGQVTKTGFWLDRLIGYLAIGLAIGAFVFWLGIWRPAEAEGEARERFDRAVGRLLFGAVIAGILSALAALPLQVVTAGGAGNFFSGCDPSKVSEILNTRFGTVMAVRAGAFAAAGVLLLIALRNRRLRPLVALPLVVVSVTPALSGHADTQDPTWLLVPAATLHVIAMSAWFGGLFVLLAALPRATGALEPARRTPLLASALGRFSTLALASVLTLAVTGTIQAIAELEDIADLWQTGFGRAILAKIVLLLALMGLGALNRQRFLPAIRAAARKLSTPGRVGVSLRNNLRLEVLLIAVVLAVTAVLVSYAPPGQTSGAGSASGRTDVGDEVLEYTVDPAKVGPNQFHLYLFDKDTGAQFDGAKEVTAEALQKDKGIGPLPITLNKSGPGHYVAPSALLGAPGEWTITVHVRTSKFDEDEAEIEVPVS